MTKQQDDTNNKPGEVRSSDELGLVERLRQRQQGVYRQNTKLGTTYLAGSEPDSLCCEAADEIERLMYDASVGQRWRETSRLEDWFPFTAEELARLRAALLACARMAEALKRDCGTDPESPQAVRNAEYQRISTAAHVALGTIRGAQLLMPREQIAMLWNSLPIDLEAESIVSFVRGVERYHGLVA